MGVDKPHCHASHYYMAHCIVVDLVKLSKLVRKISFQVKKHSQLLCTLCSVIAKDEQPLINQSDAFALFRL